MVAQGLPLLNLSLPFFLRLSVIIPLASGDCRCCTSIWRALGVKHAQSFTKIAATNVAIYSYLDEYVNKCID